MPPRDFRPMAARRSADSIGCSPLNGTEIMRSTAPAAGRAGPRTFEHTAGLPDALLDPAAYPDRPESVELRETHISWVFLAGETAYKVKKPFASRSWTTAPSRAGRRAATPSCGSTAASPQALPRRGRSRASRSGRPGGGVGARSARRRVRRRDEPLRRVHDPGRPPRRRPSGRGRPRRRRRCRSRASTPPRRSSPAAARIASRRSSRRP